ncbi:UDP-glucose:undecaprenyl-phosphate glucose-1-phosphate transferase [Candidatus Methylobacter favarea]|uniref:UDP-glucose:undecaprenyl-phosphate glucose-1-phosphate transferase n=1 Tax=Candidatus Methylobacter favarea TaxID=2707345 RepID=A0A8S0X9L2_9GAMM|nr:undecaprenyl-phosphate glucose phosphotransferase [Candidatus Methylobacter favarea]CAA9892406.1 UDP-glucose:undecaprenyl-phosphate glucose-1-phosphate transferase [Candidatus Methylobacter favarea]
MQINELPLIRFIRYAISPVVVAGLLALLAQIHGIAFAGPYLVLAALVFLLVLQILGDIDLESNFKRFWIYIISLVFIRWLIVSGILVFIGYMAGLADTLDPDLLMQWVKLTPFVLVAAHLFLRFLLCRLYSGQALRTAVIVGVNELSIKLARHLEQQQMAAVHCLGFFDDRGLTRLQNEQPLLGNQHLLGSLKDTAHFVKDGQINVIYIALPMAAQSRIHALLEEFGDTTASIYYLPDVFMYDLIQERMLNIHGVPLVALCESPFTGINALIKRLCDIVLSTVILLTLSPFLLVIGTGVKLTSPGPVLFRQKRYGLDGEEIDVYKFRSMTVCENGDQITQAKRNDPRITPFGRLLRKTSLDELPQFINVLQGSMSIVGPRPHAVAHNELYRKQIKGYMIRHKVKPGVTGWAQVNGCRGETETLEKMQARIEYDLDYLRNWSLILDILIILRTVNVVIKGQNAY